MGAFKSFLSATFCCSPYPIGVSTTRFLCHDILGKTLLQMFDICRGVANPTNPTMVNPGNPRQTWVNPSEPANLGEPYRTLRKTLANPENHGEPANPRTLPKGGRGRHGLGLLGFLVCSLPPNWFVAFATKWCTGLLTGSLCSLSFPGLPAKVCWVHWGTW